MPIVEGSAVPVHSIAFRASSPKQAQELARFAAPFGAFSPPGTRSGRPGRTCQTPCTRRSVIVRA